ncbi:MAG TPA: M14 family zinc carboxypeptidase [Bryobacteraceae bacterium]|nr:M14 family zinc carboxypeptidase [Bryobacteraceae bacterium]
MRSRLALSAALLALSLVSGIAVAQSKKGAKPAAAPALPAAAAPQKTDEEYTKLIKEYLQDPRITTELVDHMPASETVPSPLKFFGRIPGTPGELTYAKDINRYYEALAKASPRAKYWRIGTTEEGRDQVILAIADEATIASLDKYKDMLAQLGDPRKITQEQAKELFHTAKPIYYANSGIHSPETGGPEMLIELAYRLIVEETPFIQTIRNNSIVMITPVIEVDGREKVVDAYYASKKTGVPRNALTMYWGKYVQHDNNRDGMGQFLKCTQNFTRAMLEWHPTIVHDLHEAQSYLYVSTGTGPYNVSLDPIAIDEWWLLGETEIMEMAKRGVPGVWTYGFYDGWVPNYLFWIALTHNSFGRFYEVQSYGPDNNPNLTLAANTTSREWYRPNPPLPTIKWGPRNNTNIQESALLFAMNQVAKNRELYLENYYMKNKRAIEKGKNGPTYAWLIPAGQRRKADAADTVNDLRTQGVEVHRADSAFKAGSVDVAAGDYIIRGDQPYRTLADMYFSIQNYPVGNPNPYDDTGWTMQYMRDVRLVPLTDKSVLSQPMTMLAADAKAAGGIEGSGSVLVVEHTGDNNLTAFRFRNKDVAMSAAEEDFEISGHKFRAGAFLIPNADRARLEPQLKDLGLSAWAVASAPAVKTHPLTIPRIGYVHSWSSTQNEGWTRAALDYYGIPYTYFADKRLREGNLRAKYDVIIFPHVGGNTQSMLNGVGGNSPIPYKKSEVTPNLGAEDSSDDIRGGMGFEGLLELSRFVQEGGTLITEGSTASMMAEYDLGAGITVEHPANLFARGTILRGVFADLKSPIAYGYDGKDLPVYFSQDPVFSTGGGAGGGFGGFGGRGGSGRIGANGEVIGQNITPNATPIHLSPLELGGAEAAAGEPAAGGRGGRGSRGAAGGGAAGGGGFGGGRGGFAAPNPDRARVVLEFPSNADTMLLSGTLAGGEALQNRALALDAPLGKGHIVMFALRPFWRWQTQGTYSLAFNAIVNWDHLDAGKAAATAASPSMVPGPGQ